MAVENFSLLINTLILEFKDRLDAIKGSIEREGSFSEIANKIKVAIGVRRSGKTFFCYQKIQKILNQGIPLSRILYINFEDDRLLPTSQSLLVNLLEAFYSLYPENHDQVCYLFLDEIQNVEDWPIVVRRFFDTHQVEIYLTGSSAKLLSKEIATSLRGRSIATEVWPFSFNEYLRAKNFVLPEMTHAKKSKDQIHSYLLSYLSNGGFPDVINANFNDRVQVLQELVDVVVFRDIIERHRITNISLIKYLIKTLINNVATTFSVNKFCNDLRSQGIQVSKNTVHGYISYVEDAFLIFTVPIYSNSLRKMQIKPKKIYVVDPGLYQVYVMSYHSHVDSQLKNAGRVFENFIYLVFRRLKLEIYYYSTENGYEVDFLTRDLHGIMKLYQVVWDIADKNTFDREHRALQEAKKELGIEGVIITPDNFLSEFGSFF